MSAGVDHVLDYLNGGGYFWVALIALIIAVLARKLLPDAPLVGIISLVSIACILAFTVQLSMASTRDFGRYIAPIGASIVVFLAYEILRTLDSGTWWSDRRTQVTGFAVIGTVIVCAFLVFTPVLVERTNNGLFAWSWNVLREPDRHPDRVFADELSHGNDARDLRRAIRLVDPEHTILAVDRPYVLDYTRYDMPNMDFPGWASPTGTFPYFKSPATKLEFLRRQGFENLIVTVPAGDDCLAPNWLHFLRNNAGPPDRIYARYFLDWQNALAAVQSGAPGAVTRVGGLWVIDLDRATSQLQRASSR